MCRLKNLGASPISCTVPGREVGPLARPQVANGGQLQTYRMNSRGQPTRDGPRTWESVGSSEGSGLDSSGS